MHPPTDRPAGDFPLAVHPCPHPANRRPAGVPAAAAPNRPSVHLSGVRHPPASQTRQSHSSTDQPTTSRRSITPWPGPALQPRLGSTVGALLPACRLSQAARHLPSGKPPPPGLCPARFACRLLLVAPGRLPPLPGPERTGEPPFFRPSQTPPGRPAAQPLLTTTPVRRHASPNRPSDLVQRPRGSAVPARSPSATPTPHLLPVPTADIPGQPLPPCAQLLAASPALPSRSATTPHSPNRRPNHPCPPSLGPPAAASTRQPPADPCRPADPRPPMPRSALTTQPALHRPPRGRPARPSPPTTRPSPIRSRPAASDLARSTTRPSPSH